MIGPNVNNKLSAAAMLLLVVLIIYPATFYFDSRVQSAVRELEKHFTRRLQMCNVENKEHVKTEVLAQNIQQVENTGTQIANMEEALSFLNPDIGSSCGEIFKTDKTAPNFIAGLLEELKNYDQVADAEKKKIQDTGKKPTGEGYCSQDAENTYIMAKLARYVP